MKGLIIVESPTKAKTISTIVGKEFVVVASLGHIVDLPDNRMGIDLEKTFEPEYIVLPGKKNIVSRIKWFSRRAKSIFLASDPDREGEAIAWHIFRFIDKDDRSKVRRITFNEISQKAITEALNNPKNIDMNLVGSYLARRIIDRIVGYSLSPILWDVFKDRKLSAGRVQSVALRLICEREREIINFVPKVYWQVFAEITDHKGNTFELIAVELDGKSIKIFDKEEATALVDKIKGKKLILEKIDERRWIKRPEYPFKTSTLQQVANAKLGYSANYTMKIAQRLYEGMDIPGIGRRSLITYIRTDSVRVSVEALEEARRIIADRFGKEYLGDIGTIAEKGRIQGSHEAIRPVYLGITPESITGRIEDKYLKLYELIYYRFLASVMASAIYNEKTYLFKVEGEEVYFKLSVKKLVFDGFLKLYGKCEEDIIPDIIVGDIVFPQRIFVKKEKTKPPERYTEATLIRTLEEKEIGRPSTYASCISTLIERGYVKKNRKTLIPTKLGFDVFNFLVQSFPEIVDINFTARMEDKLDTIAKGKVFWKEVVKEFYSVFAPKLDNFKFV